MTNVVSTDLTIETFVYSQLPIILALLVHAFTQFVEPTSLEVLVSFACFELFQVLIFHSLFQESIRTSIFNSLRSTTIFLAAICSSIVLYRLAFHRLNRFPGRKSLIASKWAMIPTDLKGQVSKRLLQRTLRRETQKNLIPFCEIPFFQRPYLMQKLHSEYGKIVRFGPREISINDPEELPSIYGASAKNSKGPLYSFMQNSGNNPATSVLTAHTMAHHALLRKNWDAGFSVRALKSYEGSLIKNVELAISQISNIGKDGKAVAIDEVASWLGFDLMGEIGFSRSFGNLERGKTVEAIKLIQEAIVMTMALGNAPYLADLLRLLPNPMLILDAWVSDALKERLETLPEGDNQSDIISHLVKENKSKSSDSGSGRLSFKEIKAETGVLVVGGSDTSSNTICLALFHLIDSAGAYRKAQEEVDRCFSGAVADDLNKLAKDCPYLNAVIQEALRLWPPVASGLQRLTPLEGLVLKSGVRIPGNVVVSTPTYVMHRDSQNFSHPNEFRPERWMDNSEETVHNAKAFSAFGYGPTGCVGRQLGLMELRLFIARFIQTFDAAFAVSPLSVHSQPRLAFGNVNTGALLTIVPLSHSIFPSTFSMQPEFDPATFTASIKDYFLIAKDPCLITVKPRAN